MKLKDILKESVSELIGKDFSSVDPEIRYYKKSHDKFHRELGMPHIQPKEKKK